MSRFFEHPGYKESILYSSDDFEPYGYSQPPQTDTLSGSSGAGHGGHYRPGLEEDGPGAFSSGV